MGKPSEKRDTQRRRYGLGQLTLVEHALCPLDGAASLVEGLVHDAEFFYTDASRHRRKAKARVTAPLGLAASDELYLWALLAITLAEPEGDGELFATPHFLLRRMGLIDQHTRRGGRQYQQFREALERLSMVHYRCDQFYDATRREHRSASFGLLSYSLPVDAKSCRGWRIAWDRVLLDLTKPLGGHLYFDLDLYRSLDPASRRLSMLLAKIFHRRDATPPFDLRQLAVQTLGFSGSVATKHLKVKLQRICRRLQTCSVIADFDIRQAAAGQYRIRLTRGPYFERKSSALPAEPNASALHDLLISIGFDTAGAASVIRRYPAKVVREWADITMAAEERFGKRFFRRSQPAYLVDNVKRAVRNCQTPPDWWHELRKEEQRQKAERNLLRLRDDEGRVVSAGAGANIVVSVEEKMFRHFVAAGQSVVLARQNAIRCSQESLQHE